jgi:hypothetical protein
MCTKVGTHFENLKKVYQIRRICASLNQFVPNLAHQKHPKKGPIFRLFSDADETHHKTQNFFSTPAQKCLTFFKNLLE